VSKAFTRESDDASADEVASVRLPSSSGARNYITREGADRLRQRHIDLLEEKRVLAGKRGDNDPDSRAALKRLEPEIQRLQATLDSAIIAERPSDRAKVALGAWVRVRDEEGEEETYQIVGIDEADPGQGRISSASPLGRVLLTRRAGENVHFRSPAGQQQLTLLSVRY